MLWDSVSEPDGRFMDDAAFKAMFHGDALIGVTGGPSAPLEPVLLRSQAAQRDVFCWKRGETTASPQQLFDFNGMNAQAMHERALAMLERAAGLKRVSREAPTRVSRSEEKVEPMNPKIIVLDDDPTGSQTVHSCLLLTRWDVATLKTALADAAPLFFVLTNTRGMDAERAAAITREVCVNLKAALADYAGPVLFVSRSDSTLRGHYPVETDVMNAVLGPFDATLLTPAFFEGGRITRDSTHYLIVDGKPVPTHETEFARDSVFGYRTAFLPDYVAEKTGGRVAADAVQRLTLADLRGGGTAAWLAALHDNAIGVVDGETADDYRLFADAALQSAAAGKRLLFRSAASLLTALAKLPPQPVPADAFASLVREQQPGAVIVGSHVAKTTAQLTALLKQRGVVGLPLDVARCRPGVPRWSTN